MKNISRDILLKENVEFIVLGTDYTAYGIARVIYDNYNIKPKVFGSKALMHTSYSKILDRKIFENFNKEQVFLDCMISYAKENNEKKLFLFPVSDIYTGLLIRNKDKLKDYYYFNVPTLKNSNELLNKEDFYKSCERYNIPYPYTKVISSFSDLDLNNITYPVVVKWDNSVLAYKVNFKEKEKVYIIDNEDYLIYIIKKIYEVGYEGRLIIQEFIPGGDSTNYSLNAYVDTKGKVRMMVLGQALLGDKDPKRIGNHNAIYTLENKELYEKYREFLEKLEYRGFANFDIKYDPRNNSFKTFEVNIRFPASVFFLYAGGVNYIDFYIRDFLGLDYEEETYFHSGCKNLYLNCDKKLILNYIENDYKELAKNLVKKGPKWTIWYEKDKSIKRWLMFKKRNKKTIDDFKKYYKNK